MRPLENGASADGEVLFAREAAEVAGHLADLDALGLVAVRAYRLPVPAALFEVQPGSGFIRKLLE